MIRPKKERQPIIDLTGPQGNAFSLLAAAKQYHSELTRLGLPSLKEIQSEMTSGDYENLILVFDKYFGEYVILER